MRATSVIFLIVSVVLALIGIVTCAIGVSLAEEQGIELFDTVSDADDNIIYTYNYAGDGIKKIAVDIGDADVNIYGGSDADYIELVNFTQGSYDLTATNLTLSLVDNSSLLKMFSIGQNGINFHGFRHYLHSLDLGDKPRSVNIYLTEKSAVTLLDIAIESGNFSIDNVQLAFDLSIELETGNVVLQNINTTSDLRIKLLSGSVKSQAVTCRAMQLEAETAGIDLDTFHAEQSVNVDIGAGDIHLFPTQRELNGYDVRLTAGQGAIRYFGESVGAEYTVNSAQDENHAFVVKTGNGNIIVE